MLIVMLSLSLMLTACSSNDKDESNKVDVDTPTETSQDSSSSDQNSILTEPGTFPIVTEPVTLRIFFNPPEWVGDLETNKVTKWYEELTGVHIKWERAGQDASQRINLMLASQTDLPDAFMMSGGMSQEQQITYGSQGIFLPLNDLIENQGFYIKNLFKYAPDILDEATAPDGNIYGLPRHEEAYHTTLGQRAWINQKWLDNLGLEIPETTDDFYEVLKAFNENDANGNGNSNDEIPLIATNAWQGYIDGFLMNPFVFNAGPSSLRLMIENDTVVPSFIQPQWREGLKYLRKLYAEGLMDQEVFITDRNQVRMLVENPDGNRVGVVMAGALGQFADLNKDTKLEYTAIPPLRGPKGLRQTPLYPFITTLGTFVITNACENPELAFRWADGLYTYEDKMEWRGEEGVDWKYADEGQVGLDGRPARYEILIPYTEPTNSWWSDKFTNYATVDYRNSQATDLEAWNQEKILFDESKAKYEPYAVDKVLPSLFLSLEAVEVVSELRPTIAEYVEESIARFITGDLDINDDNVWNRYLNELENMGLERYIELLQQGYGNQYLNN